MTLQASLLQRRVLIRSMVLAVAGSLVAASVSLLPVQAQAGYQVLELSVAGRAYADVVQQAEQLARSEVLSQFSANPQLSEVQIDILGQRNGQVVPILSIRVSRQEWQSSPQISRWTRYYSTAYALLNPGGSSAASGPIAAAPVSRQIDRAPDPVVQLEQAARDGQISDREYIQLRDALD